jgi:hypothetical protein
MSIPEIFQSMPNPPFAATRCIVPSLSRWALSFAAATLTIVVLAFSAEAHAQQPGTPVLLDAMTTELHRAFTSLGKQGDEKQLPPYFLSYSVSDASLCVDSRAVWSAGR